MGLKKEKKLKNGITTNYHRIVSVNSVINHATSIEVCSYISEEMRQAEKTAIETNEVFDGYTRTTHFALEYAENFSAKDAYKWLKKHEEFVDAIDV